MLPLLLAAQNGYLACLEGLLDKEKGRGYNHRRSHKQQAASRPQQRKAKRERQTHEETRRKQREEGGITPRARRSHGRKDKMV